MPRDLTRKKGVQRRRRPKAIPKNIFSDYTLFTVEKLKQELRHRNLRSSGVKAELINRLENDDLRNPIIPTSSPQSTMPIGLEAVQASNAMIAEFREEVRRKANQHRKDSENAEENMLNMSQKNGHTVLKDGYSGVEEQRRFVEIALKTPDFAILEGPPGSGKTAVITEIILRAIEKCERVLLCASTHVAVDNLVRRVKDDSATFRTHMEIF